MIQVINEHVITQMHNLLLKILKTGNFHKPKIFLCSISFEIFLAPTEAGVGRNTDHDHSNDDHINLPSAAFSN